MHRNLREPSRKPDVAWHYSEMDLADGGNEHGDEDIWGNKGEMGVVTWGKWDGIWTGGLGQCLITNNGAMGLKHHPWVSLRSRSFGTRSVWPIGHGTLPDRPLRASQEKTETARGSRLRAHE